MPARAKEKSTKQIEAGIQRLNTNKMLKEPVPAASTLEPSMQYKIVSSTLEGNGEYMFPIYLRNDQTLNISWFVKEGEKVWFHIFTPSDKNLGFYENGQYANGTLSEGFCQGFTEGRTKFSPSEYGWGEGYYQMFVTSNYTSYSRVEVQYWIDES